MALLDTVRSGLHELAHVASVSPLAAPPPMPDVPLNPPENQQNTIDFLGVVKWICLMILTTVALWRVVMVGISWSGGNPAGLRSSLIGLVGVLLSIYIILNLNDFYDFFSDMIPF